jgi:hypothetical protein
MRKSSGDNTKLLKQSNDEYETSLSTLNIDYLSFDSIDCLSDNIEFSTNESFRNETDEADDILSQKISMFTDDKDCLSSADELLRLSSSNIYSIGNYLANNSNLSNEISSDFNEIVDNCFKCVDRNDYVFDYLINPTISDDDDGNIINVAFTSATADVEC